MRVLPILFNTDMVRAILEDRKTVTRRVVKWDKVDAVLSSPARMGNPNISDDRFIKCLCTAPCEPGDILYVRETWRPNDFPWMDEKYIYKADEHNADWDLHKWRPSIHMPKEAARLFLRVTGVRVELLQDIDGLGAFDEGAVAEMPGACLPPNKPDGFDKWNAGKQNEYIRSMATSAYIAKLEFANRLIKAYAKVWDSTMPRKLLPLCGWSANPWVWVIEFERVSKEVALAGCGKE